MRVVRVVGYHQNLELQEAEEPKITSPLDVIVKIGAAGVCRTDIHILEGQWEDKSQVKLPYTIGKSVTSPRTKGLIEELVVLEPLIHHGTKESGSIADHCIQGTKMLDGFMQREKV